MLGIDLSPEDLAGAGGDALWPEHVEAMDAFLSIASQWRVIALADGTTRTLGLDYGTAKSGMELAGITISPEVWDQVRLIEVGACGAMNGNFG